MRKKLSQKPKSFCAVIKQMFVERKLFFSILFLAFSIFVFTMGTQVFVPVSTFSKTIIKKKPQAKPKAAVENVRAITLLPASDGYYDDWTASTSTRDHFTLIDDMECNREDYVSSETYQEKESYGVMFNQIPDGSRIKQIDITPCASATRITGTPSSLQTFYRMDGVDSDMKSHIIPDSTDPKKVTVASWKNLNLVKIAASTFEIGIQNGGGERGLKVSNLRTQILYVPPAPTSATSTPPTSTSTPTY